MVLERELETYRRSLAALLEQDGRFALIQGDQIVDVLTSYEDALKEGYEKFGIHTPFLVKQIQSVEQVLNMTRDLQLPCRT